MLLAALSIYVMVNERKCFYKDVKSPDTLIFYYDTQSIGADNVKDPVVLSYKYDIAGSNGKPLKGDTIQGKGSVEVLVNTGVYKLCLEHINNPNQKMNARQLARYTKRINVQFVSMAEVMEKNSTQTEDTDVQQIDHLLVKAKAIQSQQTGSEYRRTSLEKGGRSLRIYARVITLLSCFCYILFSVLMVRFLKRHFKHNRL